MNCPSWTNQLILAGRHSLLISILRYRFFCLPRVYGSWVPPFSLVSLSEYAVLIAPFRMARYITICALLDLCYIVSKRACR